MQPLSQIDAIFSRGVYRTLVRGKDLCTEILPPEIDVEAEVKLGKVGEAERHFWRQKIKQKFFANHWSPV